MSVHPSISLANRAMIVKDGSVLVLQRSLTDRHQPGVWEFPGGKVEMRETLYQGLEKEVFEETGLRVRLQHPLAFPYSELNPEDGSAFAGFLYLAFLAHGANRRHVRHQQGACGRPMGVVRCAQRLGAHHGSSRSSTTLQVLSEIAAAAEECNSRTTPNAGWSFHFWVRRTQHVSF